MLGMFGNLQCCTHVTEVYINFKMSFAISNFICICKCQNLIQYLNFVEVHRFWSNFVELHRTSWNFIELHRTSSNFIELRRASSNSFFYHYRISISCVIEKLGSIINKAVGIKSFCFYFTFNNVFELYQTLLSILCYSNHRRYILVV